MAESETTTMTEGTLTDDGLYRSAAIDRWTKDKLQIEDDAVVSAGEGGAWVQAWVWVSDDQAGIDDASGPE